MFTCIIFVKEFRTVTDASHLQPLWVVQVWVRPHDLTITPFCVPFKQHSALRHSINPVTLFFRPLKFPRLKKKRKNKVRYVKTVYRILPSECFEKARKTKDICACSRVHFSIAKWDITFQCNVNWILSIDLILFAKAGESKVSHVTLAFHINPTFFVCRLPFYFFYSLIRTCASLITELF
jgi:hypothetical protein